MKWERRSDGSSFVYAARHILGFIGQMYKPDPGKEWVWQISAVAGSKFLPVTQGHCSTERLAKRALRRAWLRWIADHGLTEKADAPPNPHERSRRMSDCPFDTILARMPYLVLPKMAIQAMPLEWRERLAALLDEAADTGLKTLSYLV